MEYKFKIKGTMVSDLNSPTDDIIYTTTATYTLRVGCGYWETLTKDPTYLDIKLVYGESTSLADTICLRKL